MLKLSLITSGQPPTVILDETRPRPTTDFCLNGFEPEPLRQFQNTPAIRAAAPFMADRFNMYSKWDFTVLHSFATIQACQDFIGGRASIGRVGEAQIYFSFGGQNWTRYYKTAYLVGCAPVKGRVYPISAFFQYSLLMNSLFSQQP